LIADNSPIVIRKNFGYKQRHSGNASGGAVLVDGATFGQLRYNSIAYNPFAKKHARRLAWHHDGATVVDANIIGATAGDPSGKPQRSVAFGSNCTVTAGNLINNSADGAHFRRDAPMTS